VFPVPAGDVWMAEFKYSDGTTVSMPLNHTKED